MLKLVPVRAEERELLWNINQKYLYEMTNFYPDEMDGEGNLHYGYFDEYFRDPKRKAFFIFNDEKMVGFVMIHPYSVISGAPDYTMAEFTIFPSYRKNHFATDTANLIFPSYRKNGYAKEAVNLIFDQFKGKWEIKFNEKNHAAKKLWTTVAAPHCPRVYRLNEEETVLTFEINK